MDREGIKSIASMRKGKGKQLVPAPPVGTLPGGPYPSGRKQAGIRTSAKQAYQSEAVFAGNNVAPNIANIVAERQGPLLAGQQARQIDFDKVAAQRQNVENLMLQNNKYVLQKTTRDAHQELDQLANTLGSAYKELHPLQRHAIEARAEQLRHLVRSRDPDKVLEAGRARQRAYMKENALRAERERRRRMPLMTQSEPGTTTERLMGLLDEPARRTQSVA